MFIKLKIGKFSDAYYSLVYFRNSVTAEQVEEHKASLRELSEILEGGNYLMHKTLGTDELTFADVMLFPHIHRLSVHREFIHDEAKTLDLSRIWAWHDRIYENAWAHVDEASDVRLINGLKQVFAAGYDGLRTPLTYYDQE